MFDTELESFKNGIDLRAYAAEQGYQLDRKESWRGSASCVTRTGTRSSSSAARMVTTSIFRFGRTTITARSSTSCRHRQRLSLGAVRKELRPYIGMPSSQLPAFPPLPKTSKDRLRVETEYAKMQDAPRHPYLENERALPASLLELERFAGRVRMDARGNAVFPHFDQGRALRLRDQEQGLHGLCCSGGTKGLWLQHVPCPMITGSCFAKARLMP